MTDWAAVDRYLEDLLVPSVPDGFDADGLPRHEVAPNQGRLLELLAQAVGARAILELGTLGGYSTTWLARGLFDLIFVDADKQSNPEYLGEALRLSRPGTLIVADNVVRDGAVMDPGSEDPSVQGARRFLELVAEEPRLLATALQTVGAKGHDGFMLALVTS